MSLIHFQKISKIYSPKCTALDNIELQINSQEFVSIVGRSGSGKTTLTQGIADGLGIKDRITSPTFVLMKKFSNLYHIDCYRLQKPTDILGLGWQEIMENPKNIVVVEWPERIKKFLPKKTISVRFKFISLNQRKVTMV